MTHLLEILVEQLAKPFVILAYAGALYICHIVAMDWINLLT